jgi:regulator of replication initiation timing
MDYKELFEKYQELLTENKTLKEENEALKARDSAADFSVGTLKLIINGNPQFNSKAKNIDK